MYNNSEIEIVTEVKYLGILLSKTGSFIHAKKDLIKRATKSMFAVFKKSRTGNVKLPIETGRWFNIKGDDRICHLCKCDVVDEFHYIFNCTSLSAEKNEYIPSYYTNRASAFYFFHLFSTKQI